MNKKILLSIPIRLDNEISKKAKSEGISKTQYILDALKKNINIKYLEKIDTNTTEINYKMDVLLDVLQGEDDNEFNT